MANVRLDFDHGDFGFEPQPSQQLIVMKLTGADIMKNNHCNAGGKQIEQVWKDNIIYFACALYCVLHCLLLTVKFQFFERFN